MKSNNLWSVDLGVGMGPLKLGTEYKAVLQNLQEQRIDVDRLTLDRSGELSIPELGTRFQFSEATTPTLIRIDVEDNRIRFGPLSVIGKRAHEIIGLFKVPRKETSWSNLESNDASFDASLERNTNTMSRELLARGTIWIPSLGLGLSLRDGLVETVHLCDPAYVPQSAHGPWTKEQQRLSEVRELPPASIASTTKTSSTFLVKILIPLFLILSIGILFWLSTR